MSLALPAATAVGVTMMLPALIDAPRSMPVYALAAGIMATGLANIVLRLQNATQWAKSGIALSLSETAAAAALLCAVVWLRTAPSGATDLDWPVRGEWRVVSGGRLGFMNHHVGNPPAQSFAIDMVSANPTNPTLGSAVLAPASGTVIRAASGGDTGEAEGNHVVIRAADGTELWLAHLKENSVIVKEGDSVTAGQPIGQCGATGSADAPHLHIHAQKDGKATPMRFGPTKQWLIRADTFRAGA